MDFLLNSRSGRHTRSQTTTSATHQLVLPLAPQQHQHQHRALYNEQQQAVEPDPVVTRLREPYFKYECADRSYKPVFHEFSRRFPRLSFEGRAGTSPFYSPETSRARASRRLLKGELQQEAEEQQQQQNQAAAAGATGGRYRTRNQQQHKDVGHKT